MLETINNLFFMLTFAGSSFLNTFILETFVQTSLIIDLFYSSLVLSFLDPLEQFEILLVSKFFGLTNLTAVVFFIFFFTFCLLASISNPVLTNAYSYFASLIYNLVKTIAKENLHLRRHQYFLMLFYLFLTIFLSNLVGLIPYSFTPTSSFMMTFFLALGHFIGINFIAATQTR